MQQQAVIVRVVDLETTGSRPPGDGVVELGWQDVAGHGEAWALEGAPGAVLVNPGRPIPAKTSAIHHLIDEDVAGAPTWEAPTPPVLAPPDRPLAALAAHRIEFERRWCTDKLSGGLPWVCTYKCALRLWPEEPSHSNQGLRYSRRPDGLMREPGRSLGLPAHRAGPDAFVTAHHLRDMLALASLEQLVAWSREPALLVRVPFGAHRGKRWRDLEDGYLDWVLDGRNFDRDILFTARTERARRQAGRQAEHHPELAAVAASDHVPQTVLESR